MKNNVGKERSNRLSPEQEKNKLLKQVKQDTDTIERLGRQIKGGMLDYPVRFLSILRQLHAILMSTLQNR